MLSPVDSNQMCNCFFRIYLHQILLFQICLTFDVWLSRTFIEHTIFHSRQCDVRLDSSRARLFGSNCQSRIHLKTARGQHTVPVKTWLGQEDCSPSGLPESRCHNLLSPSSNRLWGLEFPEWPQNGHTDGRDFRGVGDFGFGGLSNHRTRISKHGVLPRLPWRGEHDNIIIILYHQLYYN